MILQRDMIRSLTAAAWLLLPPDTLGTLPAVGEPGEILPSARDTGGMDDLVAEEALVEAALHLWPVWCSAAVSVLCRISSYSIPLRGLVSFINEFTFIFSVFPGIGYK